jgi:probable HAF family extracellular repeat protein
MPGSFNGPFGRVMNNQGHVAGTSLLLGDEERGAFIWSNGQMTNLGSLGGNATDAYAINNNDQVVGRSRTANVVNSHHPFLWENGQMIDLGVIAACTRGTATTINSRGETAGGFGGCVPDPDDRAVFRGFYLQRGRPIVDVNTLISPASDIWVDEISFINDAESIGWFRHSAGRLDTRGVAVPVRALSSGRVQCLCACRLAICENWAHGRAPCAPQVNERFAETSWSVVIAASAITPARAHAAMAELCRMYWRPIYLSPPQRLQHTTRRTLPNHFSASVK